MFIWDYIVTFGMEVDLIWNWEWTFMKGLYIFQRYLPFIDTAWLVLYCKSDAFSMFFPSFFVVETGVSLTKTECRNLYCAMGGS